MWWHALGRRPIGYVLHSLSRWYNTNQHHIARHVADGEVPPRSSLLRSLRESVRMIPTPLSNVLIKRASCRYARGLNRLKPIFQQVAASFAQTIRPNEKTRAIIAVVQKEFTAWLMTRPWNPRADRYLGVHIRRGDRLGSSWRYHDKHIPTEVYAQAAQMAWARNVSSTVPTSTDAYQQPAIYLASDDQTLHEELEESLSSGIVFSLARSTLPALKDLASPRPYVQAEFNALPEEERIRQTRGMLADFAMISGMWTRLDSLKPDAVVCAMRRAPAT